MTLYNIWDAFTLSGFVFNVICSLVASFIFIFTLFIYLKPKFVIAPFIAREKILFGNKKKICYSFKIINKSFFVAYDISATACFRRLVRTKDGSVNLVSTPITLASNNLRHASGAASHKWGHRGNCIQFISYDKLSSLSKDNYIEFELIARHSVTGLNSIITRSFTNSELIKDGRFKEGNYQEIISN